MGLRKIKIGWVVRAHLDGFRKVCWSNDDSCNLPWSGIFGCLEGETISLRQLGKRHRVDDATRGLCAQGGVRGGRVVFHQGCVIGSR